ncbi:TIM-barrel domain-containing protein [Microbacterium elymi]|uniref:Glycoside hydrolase family 31 TIM barrel domain-containing protein n=1 Tax=Microbacterium elymi TaxID=2909587 RepID=A0ABY5NMK0_9MICO|nr:TIM-barrel domain-containing protein [Microbacterium elymi]UUT36370.1 hypothetical protein L2X98_25910 [Microbacterium elymi]
MGSASVIQTVSPLRGADVRRSRPLRPVSHRVARTPGVRTSHAARLRPTWEAFRWSMNAGLSAAASGIVYWGWDIAGFSGEIPSAELYLRATQAAAFVPIMQYHSEFNHHRTPSRDRTPWNIAERTGDARVLPVFRAYAQLRERLVPYLTAAAAESIATDRPLMRPLFFEWPDDPEVWRADVEWLLGTTSSSRRCSRPGSRSATCTCRSESGSTSGPGSGMRADERSPRPRRSTGSPSTPATPAFSRSSRGSRRGRDAAAAGGAGRGAVPDASAARCAARRVATAGWIMRHRDLQSGIGRSALPLRRAGRLRAGGFAAGIGDTLRRRHRGSADSEPVITR